MEQRKKYALWGSLKIMQDFTYIYRDFLIVSFVDKDIQDKSNAFYNGIAIVSSSIFDADGIDEIVICMEPGNSRDTESAFIKERYPDKDINTCDRYIDLFDNGIHIPEGMKLYIWGTGRSAKFFLENYKTEHPIDGFIDSYKKSEQFHGKNIVKFEMFENKQNIYIIIAMNNSTQVENKLKTFGLIHGVNYAMWGEFVWNPANMLRKVFYSKDCYNFSCDTMLNHLEILNGGNTRTCCTTFVATDIGDYLNNTLESIWNGEKSIVHRILALSTQNHTYAFCDKDMCPLFVGKKNSIKGENEIGGYREVAEYPEVVALGFDKVCNLACETCRKDIYICKEEERNITKKLSKKIREEILPHCSFLIMAGDGEVFASSAYRDIWTSNAISKLKYFRLLSNGTLFTKENWEKLKKNIKRTKVMLTVSIDAATKETYEEIRRFGKFEQLQKNMEFAGKLRKNGELAYFRMNFVVQKKNIDEMIGFVRWGKEIGADKVFFTKILNWGTYEETDFYMNVSPMEKDEITPLPELKKVLNSCEMQDPIVDLGTIRYMHKENMDNDIENYYMWELEKDVPGIFGGVK